MNQGKYTVTILKADGSTLAVSHWDRAEDALAQFGASLRLAGYPDHAVRRHLERWQQMVRLVAPAFTVLNPDFQGSVRISAPPEHKGR